MKKLSSIMFTFSLIFTFNPSAVYCSVINELEAKLINGEVTSVTYEYGVGFVYNAVRHILRHSENRCIAKQYSGSHTDYAPEDGAIYNYEGNSGLGIFFSKINDNKTKVDFVYTDGFLNRNLKCSVDGFIQELPFLLKNKNKKAYLEYTQKLRKEWDEERERENQRR